MGNALKTYMWYSFSFQYIRVIIRKWVTECFCWCQQGQTQHILSLWQMQRDQKYQRANQPISGLNKVVLSVKTRKKQRRYLIQHIYCGLTVFYHFTWKHELVCVRIKAWGVQCTMHKTKVQCKNIPKYQKNYLINDTGADRYIFRYLAI